MRLPVRIRFARIIRYLVLLACPLIATARMTELAAGQSGLGSGRVEGVVVDESDGVVPDAAVTASSDATGLSEIQTSDASGHFLFPYLSPGTYHLNIEKSGFKIAQLDNVVVMVGTTVSLRPQLRIGSENVRSHARRLCLLVPGRRAARNEPWPSGPSLLPPQGGRTCIDRPRWAPLAKAAGDAAGTSVGI